ncbi:MAG: WG repeat-containing protein [Candidatus Kapaibacterium sp.]|nr:MAG: WG repeat-containing protein [Candidatus Kapabacteria bacterium]
MHFPMLFLALFGFLQILPPNTTFLRGNGTTFWMNVDSLPGLYDRRGNELIRPQWSVVQPTHFQNRTLVSIGGTALGGTITGASWGVIDSTGLSVVPPIFDEIDLGDTPFRLFPTIEFIVRKGQFWGLLDSNGKERIALEFSSIKGTLHPDLRLVQKSNTMWGVMDIAQGKEVIPLVYQDITPLNASLFLARSSSRNIAHTTPLYGIISSNSTIVAPFVYEAVNVFLLPAPLLAVRRKGFWGVLDYSRKGECREIVPCRYRSTRQSAWRKHLAVVIGKK